MMGPTVTSFVEEFEGVRQAYILPPILFLTVIGDVLHADLSGKYGGTVTTFSNTSIELMTSICSLVSHGP